MPDPSLPPKGILSYMDDDGRGKLATYGSLCASEVGMEIIKEASPQELLYIIVSGTYDIVTGPSGQEVLLDTVGEGACFGEVSIFQPGPASATVRCKKEGVLWYIGVEHLQQYLIDWPHAGCALILGINTILSRRLKRANAVIKANEILPNFLSVRSKKRAEDALPYQTNPIKA